MTGTINPEDRELIEQTRQVNKTLSVFVFALQECDTVPTSSLLGITDMLAALTDTLRARASKQEAAGSGAGLLLDSKVSRSRIEARRRNVAVSPLSNDLPYLDE